MKLFAVLAIGLVMAAAAHAQGISHAAYGTVTKVDRGRSQVTISHGAVPSLKWPAMTMAFAVKDKALLETLQPGRKVEFKFSQQGQDYVITAVNPDKPAVLQVPGPIAGQARTMAARGGRTPARGS